MIYNLIKNNVVVNCIVADESFIKIIKDDYDLIVDVTDHRSRPDMLWVRDPDTDTYSPPVLPELEKSELEKRLIALENKLVVLEQTKVDPVVEIVRP